MNDSPGGDPSGWKAELYDIDAFDEAGNLEAADDWTTYVDQVSLKQAFEGRKSRPCTGPPVVLVPGLASTKLRVEKSGFREDWTGSTLFMDVRKLGGEAAQKVNLLKKKTGEDDLILDINERHKVPMSA